MLLSTIIASTLITHVSQAASVGPSLRLHRGLTCHDHETILCLDYPLISVEGRVGKQRHKGERFTW